MLGIFKESGKDEKPVVDAPVLPTWQKLEKRDLALAVTHPPRNVYEEMILWTEQGKLWHFPIDNEQGLCRDKDASSFHVFEVFSQSTLQINIHSTVMSTSVVLG